MISKPYKIDDYSGPSNRCEAFTLMALRKSAASRGSGSDSQNSL